MNSVQVENQDNVAEIFNVSGEFEDIQIYIDDLTGEAGIGIASRRC